MSSEDISEGSREMVDLSAEAIGSLGVHLSQIGQIISKSVNPPKRGDKSTAVKVREKLDMYKGYQEEVMRRRQELEEKMDEDFKRIKAWRNQSGTEGADLVAELEGLYHKVRAQDKLIKRKEEEIEAEQLKVRQLIETVESKDRKWAALAEDYCVKITRSREEITQRAATCSWLQCAFDDIRFKWKAAEEKEKLRIQHHQRMRKARAQARLDCVSNERTSRLMQACIVAMQEEVVESRTEKLMKELRTRHSDEMLIMHGQLAQALGDEETSKQMIAEQVRRMEEARRLQAEAERAAKLAQKEARDAKQALEKAEAQRDKANRLREEAEARELRAMQLMKDAQEEAAEARKQAEQSDQARIRAEMRQRKAEDQVRKKQKKIQSLQRMLAELGAESDSDAPPDERAPAFFVNEDGSKVPRPRTRKERMGMAYREAECSRYELRIGMAAMLDKDAMNEASISSMSTELVNLITELQHVRRSNENLLTVNKEAFDRAVKAEVEADEALSRAVLAEDNAAKAEAERKAAVPSPSRPSTSPPELEDTNLMSAPLNQGPLAPSTAGVPTWSPNRPHFSPAPGESGSPRMLLKTKSTPVIMPPLYGLSSSPSGQMSPGRLTSLAPLRKMRKPPPDWRLSWH